MSDLEKKRLSREAARNKKAEAEKSDKDESKRIARKVYIRIVGACVEVVGIEYM